MVHSKPQLPHQSCYKFSHPPLCHVDEQLNFFSIKHIDVNDNKNLYPNGKYLCYPHHKLKQVKRSITVWYYITGKWKLLIS